MYLWMQYVVVPHDSDIIGLSGSCLDVRSNVDRVRLSQLLRPVVSLTLEEMIVCVCVCVCVCACVCVCITQYSIRQGARPG